MNILLLTGPKSVSGLTATPAPGGIDVRRTRSRHELHRLLKTGGFEAAIIDTDLIKVRSDLQPSYGQVFYDREAPIAKLKGSVAQTVKLIPWFTTGQWMMRSSAGSGLRSWEYSVLIGNIGPDTWAGLLDSLR